jgi:cytoskeletal protein RodZ
VVKAEAETKTQQEEAQTVGEMLRGARLKRGKTVAEVAEELCIRKTYINAIEDMDYANIPPVPYGVGFIRSYAQYLGLNSDRIISSYRQFMIEENEGKKTTNQESIETSKPHFKHIFLGLCGLAALFIAWSVMPISEQVEEFREDSSSVVATPVILENNADAELISQLQAEDEKDGEIITSEAISEETDVEASEQEEVAEVSETAESSANGQSMKIIVSGPTWLELKQDTTVLITGRVYDNGFEYDVPNEKGLRVTVGRPHNVKFLLGGEEIPVVSVMKRKNVSLDEFLPQAE